MTNKWDATPRDTIIDYLYEVMSVGRLIFDPDVKHVKKHRKKPFIIIIE